MTYQYLTTQKKPCDLFSLYKNLGWQQYLKISNADLNKAMQNSFMVVYVYDGEKLIGTGRVISDGVINAYICGIGVEKAYRNRGIGTDILTRLLKRCQRDKLHIQLLCEEELIPYYKAKGFKIFAIGMKK